MTALSLNNVDISYGDTKVVFGAGLAVAEGESFALVGESGSGKSTIANALEQQLHELLRDDAVASKVTSAVSSAARAREQLQSMAGSVAESSQGPVALLIDSVQQ